MKIWLDKSSKKTLIISNFISLEEFQQFIFSTTSDHQTSDMVDLKSDPHTKNERVYLLNFCVGNILDWEFDAVTRVSRIRENWVWETKELKKMIFWKHRARRQTKPLKLSKTSGCMPFLKTKTPTLNKKCIEEVRQVVTDKVGSKIENNKIYWSLWHVLTLKR